MASSPPNTSGAGSRPVTDATVDNVGAGKAFDPDRPNVDSPPPKERMRDRRVQPTTRNDGMSGPSGSDEVPLPGSGGERSEDRRER